MSDCDSGLGPSSGRISALSHHSDSTVITIPDGRESRCVCVCVCVCVCAHLNH